MRPCLRSILPPARVDTHARYESFLTVVCVFVLDRLCSVVSLLETLVKFSWHTARRRYFPSAGSLRRALTFSDLL